MIKNLLGQKFKMKSPYNLEKNKKLSTDANSEIKKTSTANTEIKKASADSSEIKKATSENSL